MARPALAFWCAQDTRLDYFDLIAFSSGTCRIGKISRRVEKDTRLGRNLRRIIAGLHGPPSRLVPRHRETSVPLAVFLHGCLFVYGSGYGPIRRPLLDVPPTVDPAGPQRGDHPTVQLPINSRRPCGSRRIPIPAEPVGS